VGDANGDHHDDILALNGRSNTCSVFLNGGHGTSFTSPGAFATGPEPTGLALARLNGDAALDVAITERNADAVSVFLNNGDGGFTNIAEKAGDTETVRQVTAQADQTADALAAWWKRAAASGTLTSFKGSGELDPFIDAYLKRKDS
jgi:hypothetical protein